MRKNEIFLVLFILVLMGALMFLCGSKAVRSRIIYVESTGYCPGFCCCQDSADGLTATGRDAYLAGVAVDTREIDYGAHLDIPGYYRGPNGNGSWILVDDCGAKIIGNKIDVRFKTHPEAVEWGTQCLWVRVWEK